MKMYYQCTAQCNYPFHPENGIKGSVEKNMFPFFAAIFYLWYRYYHITMTWVVTVLYRLNNK